MELNCCEKIILFIWSYIFSIFGLIIGGILKPFSALFTCIGNACTRRIITPEIHARRVRNVQKQVLDWNAKGRKTKMCSARPGWRSVSLRTGLYKSTLTGINIDMEDIVQIDTRNQTITLEPMMSMGQLTSIILPLGWTLPVLPEFNDLTIGGLVCGAGLETSSHKYGLIHNICISFEVVVASGEIVKCSKEENPDLFHAIPGSCGTLGFVTAVQMMIIPAKKYVKLEYIPVHSLDEAISVFESQTYRQVGNEFVEGIMYGLDKAVIMVGNMVDKAERGKVNSVRRWYKPWFFKHVESFLKRNPAEEFIEYIPLRQYYHRHEQSLFWELEVMIPYANNIIFRYLFGWILPLRIFLIKLSATKFLMKIIDKIHVAQDFIVPMEKLRESLVVSHEEMRVYPIWLCPCKFINTPGAMRFLGEGDEMYVDVGIYGLAGVKEYELVKSARRLEMFCIKNRGYQALYGDVCLTREEFGQMFDSTLYLKVREEFKCEDAFPEIYQKICRDARR